MTDNTLRDGPMTENNTTLGDRIRSARLALNWSQTELARAVGCPDATISRWECDQNVPELDNLRRVAVALGVTLSSLLE